MKKIIALVLASVLCICLCLTGCSNEDNAEVLTVVMECNYAPYNWTQSTDANGAVPIKGSADYAYGYDVMMAKYLADKIGMELEIVKSDWNSLVPAVQAGTADCAIAGQSIKDERKVSVDFTTPYYYASIVVLVKADGEYADAKGLSELAGATCISQQNTVWYDVCLPQIQDADILTAADDATAMLVSLKSGNCDVVVTDMPTAKAACVANSDFKLLDFSGTEDDFEVSEQEVNIGISVQKGNAELLTKLNEALATLTEDDFTRMMDDAIAVQPLSTAGADDTTDEADATTDETDATTDETDATTDETDTTTDETDATTDEADDTTDEADDTTAAAEDTTDAE